MKSKKHINHGQQMRYFVEWGKAKKVLRETMSATEAEAQRHAIHVQALGRDKSSSDFTNDDLDKVLAAFKAISNRAGFREQMEQADQPAKRARFKVTELMSALGMDELGLQRMINARHEAGRLVTVGSAAAASFEMLGVEDLEHLALILKERCRAKWPRKGDLLTEIRLMRMECDFDEPTAIETVSNALGSAVSFERFEALDYDNLLKVVGALKNMAKADVREGDPF